MFDPRGEARRWWLQAMDDRAFVRAMAAEGRFFDKACFIAQQAAEKAVKACLYAEGRREVLGHSVVEFVRQLVEREAAFVALTGAAARLDRFYIPTRYPNGLPGGMPFQSFTRDDLIMAQQDLEAICSGAGRFLAARSVPVDPA